MKPSTKNKLKEFSKKVNRVRALISFGKLSSYNECLNELNLNPHDYVSVTPPSNQKPTPHDFNNLAKTIEGLLVLQWEKPAKKEAFPEVSESIERLYNVGDFLLESQEFKGHLEESEKQSPHQKKLSYLRSFLPIHNPTQTGKCLYFQEEAALELFHSFTREGRTALLLRANTGDGKTYCAGQVIRWLLDSGYLSQFTISPWKILYITGASIIDQSREVLEKDFGLDCVNTVHVHNYESLRSSFGLNRFLDKRIIVEQGEEHEIWEWKKLLHPALIVWDECHKLKNEGSIQSKIAQATNNLDYLWPFGEAHEPRKTKVLQLFMSASPFSRVFHAKAFACATKHKINNRIVNNKNWRDVAIHLCSPADLNEYSRVAIKKFLREFKDYIFTFKNVRRKFKAIHGVAYMDFSTPQDAQKYKMLWESFLERKRQIEGMEYGNSKFLILVQMLVFRMGAELLRAYELAKVMHDDWTKGFAPVAACAFKPTIAKAVLHLVNDFNIPRDKISIIWGGNAAFSGSAKSRYTNEQIQVILQKCMSDPMSVNLKQIKAIHAQLQADAEGLSDISPELRLGLQTKEERNKERKRFQSGKSEFCFFTFGAGKEGLSLHQNEEYLRPRRQYNTPTYNEMEMLQAEGRTARITSLSDTEITTLVYKNTIEVPVLQRVMAKRNCLNIVTTHGMGGLESEEKDIEMQKLLELAGMVESDEESEEIEQEVFNQLENE